MSNASKSENSTARGSEGSSVNAQVLLVLAEKVDRRPRKEVCGHHSVLRDLPMQKNGALLLVAPQEERSGSDFRLDFCCAIRELGRLDRKIAWMRLDGRSYGEITAELGVSRRRIATVVAFLRERLADYAP